MPALAFGGGGPIPGGERTGRNLEPKTVYIVIIPATEEHPRCQVVPDPKIVEKDSNVQVAVVNVSGEDVYVLIPKGIAYDEIEIENLENDHTFTFKLKTDAQGERSFTVKGKTEDTCLKGLPTPRIKIP
jgi:hypothetical protein